MFISLLSLLFVVLVEICIQWTSAFTAIGNVTFVYYIAAVSATIAFGCFTLSFSLKSLEENHSRQRKTQNDLTENAIKSYLEFISSREFLYVYQVLNETVVSTGLFRYIGECIKDEAKFNANVLSNTSSADFEKQLEKAIMNQSKNAGLKYDNKIREEYVFDTIKVYNELNHICYLCLDEYVIVDNFKKADCDEIVKDLYIYGKILRLYKIVSGEEVFVSLFIRKLNYK